jgi:hypothetical protein
MPHHNWSQRPGGIRGNESQPPRLCDTSAAERQCCSHGNGALCSSSGEAPTPHPLRARRPRQMVTLHPRRSMSPLRRLRAAADCFQRPCLRLRVRASDSPPPCHQPGAGLGRRSVGDLICRRAGPEMRAPPYGSRRAWLARSAELIRLAEASAAARLARVQPRSIPSVDRRPAAPRAGARRYRL